MQTSVLDHIDIDINFKLMLPSFYGIEFFFFKVKAIVTNIINFKKN